MVLVRYKNVFWDILKLSIVLYTSESIFMCHDQRPPRPTTAHKNNIKCSFLINGLLKHKMVEWICFKYVLFLLAQYITMVWNDKSDAAAAKRFCRATPRVITVFIGFLIHREGPERNIHETEISEINDQIFLLHYSVLY